MALPKCAYRIVNEDCKYKKCYCSRFTEILCVKRLPKFYLLSNFDILLLSRLIDEMDAHKKLFFMLKDIASVRKLYVETL